MASTAVLRSSLARHITPNLARRSLIPFGALRTTYFAWQAHSTRLTLAARSNSQFAYVPGGREFLLFPARLVLDHHDLQLSSRAARTTQPHSLHPPRFTARTTGRLSAFSLPASFPSPLLPSSPAAAVRLSSTVSSALASSCTHTSVYVASHSRSSIASLTFFFTCVNG